MYKRAYFLCCATYHLAVSLYYAMMVDWRDTETILVWQNNTNVEVDEKLLKKTFDKVIRVRGKDLVTYPFLEQQRYKTVNAGWLFPVSEIGKMFKEVPSGNIVFLFNDVARLTDKIAYEFGKKSGNKIILVDEGTGTYHKSVFSKKTKEKIGNLICGLKTENYIGGNKNIDVVIAREIDKLPAYQSDGRVVVKQNNIFFDIQWVNKLTKDFENSFSLLKHNENERLMLWIGEPLSPTHIDKKNEDKVLNRIFETAKNKYRIVIKKHPRDTKEKYMKYVSQYDAILVDQKELEWLPVEILTNILRPDMVLTPLSSAPMGIDDRIVVGYCYSLFGIDNVSEVISRLMRTRRNTFVIEGYDMIGNQYPLESEGFCSDSEKHIFIENKDIHYIEALLSEEVR